MHAQSPKSTHPAWGPLAGAEQLLISYEKATEGETVAAVREVLLRHGGWLGGYLPETTLLGVGPEGVARELRTLEGVVWVVRLHLPSPPGGPSSTYQSGWWPLFVPVVQFRIASRDVNHAHYLGGIVPARTCLICAKS